MPCAPGCTMEPVPSSPYVIRLSAGERAELESLSRRATAPHRAVLRARIVLLADGDVSSAEIARRLGTCEDTVRKWRCRYCRKGAEGLADLPRPGRPRVFPAAVVTQVKALACELPAASETPLARWTCPELARKASASGIKPAPSPSTVRRWLAADALKPWQHQSWIFPRDPHFALRAGRVLDLYQREWEGQALGDDEYVISADEKPGIQARMRIHLPLPAGPGRAARIEAEYRRHGTIAYLAAYDVHRAQVTGRCEETTGTRPFTALVDQVMATEPYASAKRVFWVVDNGASHRNWAAAARMSDAYPNAHMVHLPVHASWLNQVEVYFSVLQRKALVPYDFEDLDEAAAAVLAFEKHYNAVARPFDWRFTRASLNQLLARVQKHDRHTPKPEAA